MDELSHIKNLVLHNSSLVEIWQMFHFEGKEVVLDNENICTMPNNVLIVVHYTLFPTFKGEKSHRSFFTVYVLVFCVVANLFLFHIQ